MSSAWLSPWAGFRGFGAVVVGAGGLVVVVGRGWVVDGPVVGSGWPGAAGGAGRVGGGPGGNPPSAGVVPPVAGGSPTVEDGGTVGGAVEGGVGRVVVGATTDGGGAWAGWGAGARTGALVTTAAASITAPTPAPPTARSHP
jgi:hypothetical protein